MFSTILLLMLAADPAVATNPLSTETDTVSELDPAHPKYKDCAPPDNFASKFPKTTLSQAIKSSSDSINHAKPGPLERDNPVIGAGASSNDVYVKRFFGIPVYAHNHTFASIIKGLDGTEAYSIVVSSTNYSTFAKNTIFNQLSEIFVKRGTSIVPVKLTSADENGWCGSGGEGKPPSCFSTATAIFQVEKSLFEELAQADTLKPIAITATRLDGSMQICPLYFSPLSFKAPLSMIDAKLAKAAEKRKKQLASSK